VYAKSVHLQISLDISSENAPNLLEIHDCQHRNEYQSQCTAPTAPLELPYTITIDYWTSFSSPGVHVPRQSLAKRLSGCSVSSCTVTVYSLLPKINQSPHTFPSCIKTWQVCHFPSAPLLLLTKECGVCSRLTIVRRSQSNGSMTFHCIP
jgi:hypothetical protein